MQRMLYLIIKYLLADLNMKRPIHPSPYQKLHEYSFPGATNGDPHHKHVIINYFPMQKFLKIFPNTSSVEISPVISPR